MNPIQLSNHIHEGFINYLSTIFNVNRDGKQAKLQATIEDSFRAHNSLMRGPYLEITPPYKRGNSISELCNEGILSPEWKNLSESNLPIPINAPLYLHQELAIKNYDKGYSMVISSGTGSGKTESFLIPILDDLLRNPQPGVRAVLIYPMNALVNDQLDRLRSLLKGTKITFGRYTSELENFERDGRTEDTLPNEVVSRETIRDRSLIPQILITNYAMLEYLLLRPEDSPLFETGAWRFLVLDEAHTYSGAQGIEVAYLIRRLKQRLNKKKEEMLCIATSATLTDDVNIAVEFAENIFDEKFKPNDIIFGKEDSEYVQIDTVYDVDPQAYLEPELDELLDKMKNIDCDLDYIAKRLASLGIVPQIYQHPHSSHTTVSEYLWDALNGNSHLIELRDSKQHVIELKDIASSLFRTKPQAQADQLRALYNLIELGNLARPNSKSAPMLSARYHVFMRPPQGIWVCLNPQCDKQSHQDQGWSKVFASKRERCDACNALVYPVVVCRDCGQIYIKTFYGDGKYHSEEQPDYKRRYLIWTSPQPNYALADEEDDNEEDEIQQPHTTTLSCEKEKICLNCGKEAPRNCCDSPYITEISVVVKKDKPNSKPIHLDNINECLRCSATAMANTEIATIVSVNGPTPLSVLTTELYRHLPEINNKPGNGRKLLTFYDSRQGAARFAAFLQDISNEQHYNHIIPEVVKTFEENKKYYPSLETIAEHSIQMGWDERLYHHDEELKNNLSLNRQRPSQNDRDKLKKLWETIILSEFTTRRRRRQSLESLGVIGVKYFEDDSEFDVDELASILNFSKQQTKTLIEFLLDDVRQSKSIDFPSSVSIDDERFGRNPSNPRLVKSGAQKGELPWIGQTDRQRRKLYVQKVLKNLGREHNTENVENVLLKIWNWLIQSDLFVEKNNHSYQLNYNSIFLSTKLDWCQCEQCLRIYARSQELPCPHPRCEGKLKPIDVSNIQGDNYFYQNMIRSIIPMRVEEHTAQLDPAKGRDYQDKFRDGDINVLSCSTTFEMGIDLGDLQSVIMSNVPPTVANYRQRSGRAGRRAGGTAFILTWADERPHDQAYFKNPVEIIEGHIKVPYIALDNPIIEQRHMNAVLFSAFLRYRRSLGQVELSKVAPFFEPNRPERHYEGLKPWINNDEDNIIDILYQFRPDETQARNWLREFSKAMANVDSEYQKRYSYYEQEFNLIEQKRTGDLSSDKLTSLYIKQNEFTKLRERLNDEELIRFLSDKGVIPSYSFPLYTVELVLPIQEQAKRKLRLQRDLKQAIREYAPGSEIVADKRIWRSDGVRFYHSDSVVSEEYIICDYCNHIRISEFEGKTLILEGNTCPVCDNSPKRGRKNIKKFIIPDDFFAGNKKNGIPAKQYVNRVSSDMRSALIPNLEIHDSRETALKYVECVYERNGKLLYVNEGEHGQGFKISLKGEDIGQQTKNGETVSLGHKQSTDVLHLYFSGDNYLTVPGLEDQSFWLSLMYSLIQGACKALQIERRDIDGVLSPKASKNGGWDQVIVLYDNVPGGAGHVKHIKNNIDIVIKETLRILNCTDCSPDTSCYRCIRDYNNQIYHSSLKREYVLGYLENVYYASQQNDYSITGAGIVISSNRDYWLLQQVQNSRESISIWADNITVETISGSQYDWVDVLQDCLKRRIDVQLNLRNPLTDSQVIVHYLKGLLERYPNFSLRKIEQMPRWNILIDSLSKDSARAISLNIDSTQDVVIPLVTSSVRNIVSTTHHEGVKQVQEELRHIKSSKYELPLEESGTEVISIAQGQITDEYKLFGRYFEKPVTTLQINDPYLTDRYRIVERLGTYLKMANETGQLQLVRIITSPDDRNKPSQQQKSAFQVLENHYGNKLKIKYAGAEHDRYIRITYLDGSTTRIIIGRGLDFIRSDGKCLKTFITISNDI